MKSRAQFVRPRVYVGTIGRMGPWVPIGMFLNLFLLVLAHSGIGCGPAYPIKSDVKRDLSQESLPNGAGVHSHLSPAIDLGIQVLVNVCQGERTCSPQNPPGQLEDQSPLDFEPKYFEDYVSFSRPFFLSHLENSSVVAKKKLYFVWPEVLQGHLITTVLVSHFVLSGNNTWKANLGVPPVWRDAKQKRWVLPITETFMRSEGELHPSVNPSETQVFRLDLTPEGSQSIVIQLRFRIGTDTPSAQTQVERK